MKNFIAAGSALTIPAAPYTVPSGGGCKVGSIFGVAQGSAASGEEVVLSVAGVFALAKATGALTLGQAVYWDDTAKNVTGTASGNTKIGVAVEAAGSSDTAAKIRLNGAF